MMKLKHPNIISLYQAIELHTDIYLAIELAKGGDLFEHLTLVGKVSTLHLLL